jgi:hypothetical protein
MSGPPPPPPLGGAPIANLEPSIKYRQLHYRKMPTAAHPGCIWLKIQGSKVGITAPAETELQELFEVRLSVSPMRFLLLCVLQSRP